MNALRSLAALAVVALATACGSAGEAGMSEASPQHGVAVEVENNLVPPTSLTVWIISDAGGRQMLGSVSPRDTNVLDADIGRLGSEYRLVGETTAGNEVASRPFVITESTATVTWDLTANTIVVR